MFVSIVSGGQSTYLSSRVTPLQQDVVFFYRQQSKFLFRKTYEYVSKVATKRFKDFFVLRRVIIIYFIQLTYYQLQSKDTSQRRRPCRKKCSKRRRAGVFLVLMVVSFYISFMFIRGSRFNGRNCTFNCVFANFNLSMIIMFAK